MKNKTLLPPWLPRPLRHSSHDIRQRMQVCLYLWRQQALRIIDQYWLRLMILALAVFVALQKDVSIQLSWQNSSPQEQLISPNKQETQLRAWVGQRSTAKKEVVYTAKQKRQLAYVQRFAKVAQEEMKKYGIPASITLAQGLLETNAGKSPLATKNNNHFGMKCFSKKCKKGHCSNFSDDTHKDFFIKYKTAWDSFRAHSKLLQNKRYRFLSALGTRDYKAWARGLKKAGYATDKQYADKLIRLIEDLELYRWDS